MIAYFDTSAVVPLVVAEAGPARAATLWDGPDQAVSIRLVYPEGRAALAQAQRLGRLTTRQHRAAVRAFEATYQELDLIELDDALARRAGHLAERHGLRWYDAVHLAAADRVRDPDLVVVAADRALLTAAAAEGIAIASVRPRFPGTRGRGRLASAGPHSRGSGLARRRVLLPVGSGPKRPAGHGPPLTGRSSESTEDHSQ